MSTSRKKFIESEVKRLSVKMKLEFIKEVEDGSKNFKPALSDPFTNEEKAGGQEEIPNTCTSCEG